MHSLEDKIKKASNIDKRERETYQSPGTVCIASSVTVAVTRYSVYRNAAFLVTNPLVHRAVARQVYIA
jgi:hypothetical protein